MLFRERSQIISDINVTPLIDVCLVLLIVFMVVTPIIVRGPRVDLPKTEQPKKIERAPNQFPILITFDKPPQVLFGTEFRWVPGAQLRREATALYESDPNRQLILRADRQLSFGDVKEVMRTLRDAGFHDVGLIAEKKTASPESR